MAEQLDPSHVDMRELSAVDEAECDPLVGILPMKDISVLREPDPARTTTERLLNERHASARAVAGNRLANWFPELDLRRWVDGGDTMPAGSVAVPARRVEELDLPAFVADVVSNQDCTFPKVGGIARGESDLRPLPDEVVAAPTSPADRRRVRPGPLGWMLGDGVTVVFRAVHRYHTGLATLAEALEYALHCQVGAEIHLSVGGEVAVGPPGEDQDTIAIVVAGAAHWTVGPAFEDPATPGDPDDAVWEGTLAPGEALFIPRSSSFTVRAAAREVTHYLCIHLRGLRGTDVANYASGFGGFWPLFRADVPFDLCAPVASYGGSVWDRSSGMGDALAELVTPELVEHCRAQWRAKLQPHSRGTVSDALAAYAVEDWSPVVARGSFPGGLLMALEPEAESDMITVAGAGYLLRVKEHAVDPLALLATGEEFRCGDLPVHCDDPECTSRLVKKLVVNGLADVVEVG